MPSDHNLPSEDLKENRVLADKEIWTFLHYTISYYFLPLFWLYHNPLLRNPINVQNVHKLFYANDSMVRAQDDKGAHIHKTPQKHKHPIH